MRDSNQPKPNRSRPWGKVDYGGGRTSTRLALAWIFLLFFLPVNPIYHQQQWGGKSETDKRQQPELKSRPPLPCCSGASSSDLPHFFTRPRGLESFTPYGDPVSYIRENHTHTHNTHNNRFSPLAFLSLPFDGNRSRCGAINQETISAQGDHDGPAYGLGELQAGAFTPSAVPVETRFGRAQF